jgi:general secretion pathway protein N
MRAFRDTLSAWLPARRKRFVRSGFAESTLAEIAWQRTRHAASRWGRWGVVAGVLYGLVAYAPAGWLARSVDSGTEGRLLLTEARGTVWHGSAVLVLTGGAGSRDASALPGRLQWDVGLHGLGLELRLSQDCCLNGPVALRIKPGFGRMQIELAPSPGTQAGGAVAQWPAAWLTGLGTPWNTLQLGGVLKLTASGLTLQSAQGRWHMSGQADLMLLGASSRLSTLDTLGSYRLSLIGDANTANPTQIRLDTLEGALQLNGQGQWTAGKARFRGDARAAPGSEAALNNLLNIIGRRQGALSLISIG